MNANLVRVLICISAVGIGLYMFVAKQNQLTKMRLDIPPLETKVKQLREKNRKLNYEVEQFENPVHLIELQSQPEFAHLKYPTLDEVDVVEVSVR